MPVAGGPTGYNTETMAELEIHHEGHENDPSLYSFAEGTVDGVSNISGSPELRIAGVSFSMNDIIDISAPEG